MPSLPRGGRHWKNTGSTTAQGGMRSEGRPQKPLENGDTKPKLQRENGSGTEVSSSTLLVKTNGTRVTPGWKSGVGEAQKLGHTSRRFQRSRCHGRLSSGYSWKVGSVWLVSGALLHGVYGSMEAELEVQRTIKRAELTAFFCLLKKN